MESKLKSRLLHGVMSTLLVAPILVSSGTAIANDDVDESDDEAEIIYGNDFSEDPSGDPVITEAGDAVLEWTDNLQVEGNENESGVWVTNREQDFDGLDIALEELSLEEGVDYTIQITGYVGEDAGIPEDAQFTLETVDGYDWLDETTVQAGESYELEGTYTIPEGGIDDYLRLKTDENVSEIDDVDFAILDILITAEDAEDEDEEPTDPELEVLTHELFEEDTGVAVGAGVELQHISDHDELNGAVYTGERENDYDGVDLPFENLGMEEGYTYDVSITGYVDSEEEVPEEAQALLQTPDGDYRLHDEIDLTAGESFELNTTFEWAFEEEVEFRVQTNEAGETVPFYLTEVLVEWDPNQEPPEDPGDDPDPGVTEFEFIDFEDGELNGFEGRDGDEVLTISDEENRTEDGQYSLHVSGREDDWHGPSLDVTDNIHVGEEYEISVWAMVDSDSSAELQLSSQIGDESNASYINIDSQTISPADDWVLLEGSHHYTSLGGGEVSIYVESSNETLEFYIDDVDFVEMESDPGEVETDLTPIQEVYEDDFLIGNAVSMGDMEDPRLELLTMHHNLVTAENAMKPEGQYDDNRDFDFDGQNELVDRVLEEDLLLHGHVLVWHQQSPDWHHTAEDGSPLEEDEARENMQTHIRETMENYGDDVLSWDVVNEALDGDWGDPEDWESQLRNIGWLEAMGSDYIYEAFLYARQVADENGWEDMVLYYNDYNDHVQPKARTMYYMVRDINERYEEEHPEDDRPLISGLGMQGHYNINVNPDNVRESLERFLDLDIEIGITELDVTTITEDDYVEEEWLRQGYVYARLFQIYEEYSDHISRVTFWGLNDGNSWRSERFPLLFDGQLQAKPAYHAVVDPDGFLEEHDFEDAEANHEEAAYGTPEIDAEDEEIWNEAPALPINQFQTAWQGATGVGRVLWDEDNLYVRFQVSDGVLDASAEEEHEQDSVEVFIEESGDKATSYEDGVGQYRVNYLNEASFNPTDYGEGFASATRETDSGYVVEMAIPWKTIDPVANETTIGFDLQINDAEDGAREAVAAWNDLTGQGFQDPSVFGDLTLVETIEDEEPDEVDEDEPTEVIPGQTITLEDRSASITMPDDLPVGTQIVFNYLSEEEVNALGELVSEDGTSLLIAGEVVEVDLILPEGEEEYTGEFILSLGIFDEFLEEEVFVYSFNDEEEFWQQQGGEVDENTIDVALSDLSIYGVFAHEEDEKVDDDDEKKAEDAGIKDDDKARETKEEDKTRETKEEDKIDREEEEDKTDREEEELPQTSTATFTLGLIGAISLVVGAGAHFIRKKR